MIWYMDMLQTNHPPKVNAVSSHSYRSLAVVRTFKRYCLGNLQVYDPVLVPQLWTICLPSSRLLDLIPGSRRCPGGRHGNPLQYSCLENPMDRGAWGVTVHRTWQTATTNQYSAQFSRSVVSISLRPHGRGSMPGFSVHHHLPELVQSPVHWVGDAIQPSHPLLSPSPPALNLSQHQSLFQWVGSLHQVAKALEFQLQH